MSCHCATVHSAIKMMSIAVVAAIALLTGEASGRFVTTNPGIKECRLKSFYAAVRSWPGFDPTGMSTPEEVEAAISSVN